VPASYRDHTLDPWPAGEPVCAIGRYVGLCLRQSRGTRTSPFTCSINIFTASQRGRRGVGARTVGRRCGCSHPSVRGLCRSVVFDVHARIVCGGFRIRVSDHRFCICLTEQTLQDEWRAERAPRATSGDRGRHMRGM
jgi:hypothetical protein